MRASKGGRFEREICKQLSRWWSGNGRTDVFWRTSQSGGRATQRAKKGVGTYGSYGDIGILDPIGLPLLKRFTLELKCGNSYGGIGDLFDSTGERLKLQKAFKQAITTHQKSGSLGWMLITRRDHKIPLVSAQLEVIKPLLKTRIYLATSIVRIILPGHGLIRFMVMPFSNFLQLDPFDAEWDRPDTRPA